MKELHQGIHPRFYGYAVDTNTVTFFYRPLSCCVETVAALQVRPTPAAAFHQSQCQLLPGVQRHDGMQFSNLIARDNLKVFPQVGPCLQNVLCWPLRLVLMNYFKSALFKCCLCIIICFKEQRSHADQVYVMLYLQLKRGENENA